MEQTTRVKAAHNPELCQIFDAAIGDLGYRGDVAVHFI